MGKVTIGKIFNAEYVQKLKEELKKELKNFSFIEQFSFTQTETFKKYSISKPSLVEVDSDVYTQEHEDETIINYLVDEEETSDDIKELISGNIEEETKRNVEKQANIYSRLLLLRLICNSNIFKSENSYTKKYKENLAVLVRQLYEVESKNFDSFARNEISNRLAKIITEHYSNDCATGPNQLLLLFKSEKESLSKSSYYNEIWENIIKIKGGISSDLSDINFSLDLCTVSSNTLILKSLLKNKRVTEPKAIEEIFKKIYACFKTAIPQLYDECIVLFSVIVMTKYYSKLNSQVVARELPRSNVFLKSYNLELKKGILEELIQGLNPQNEFLLGLFFKNDKFLEFVDLDINFIKLSKLYTAINRYSLDKKKIYFSYLTEHEFFLWKKGEKEKSATHHIFDLICALILSEVSFDIKIEDIKTISTLYQNKIASASYSTDTESYFFNLSKSLLLTKEDKGKIEKFCDKFEFISDSSSQNDKVEDDYTVSAKTDKFCFILDLQFQLNNNVSLSCKEQKKITKEEKSSREENEKGKKTKKTQKTQKTQEAKLEDSTTNSPTFEKKTNTTKGHVDCRPSFSPRNHSKRLRASTEKKHTPNSRVFHLPIVDPKQMSPFLQSFFQPRKDLKDFIEISSSDNTSSTHSNDMLTHSEFSSETGNGSKKQENKINQSEFYPSKEEFVKTMWENCETGIWGEAALFYALLTYYKNRIKNLKIIDEGDSIKLKVNGENEEGEVELVEKSEPNRSLLKEFFTMELDDKIEEENAQEIPFGKQNKSPIISVELFWPNKGLWEEWSKKPKNLQEPFNLKTAVKM